MTTVNTKGSFALTNIGMTSDQPEWGAALVPMNILTGSRPKMSTVPTPNSKIPKTNSDNGELTNKPLFIPKGVREFKGQECGASRGTVRQYIDAVIDEANTKQSQEELAFCIILAFHKRDIQDGAGERDLSYHMLIELHQHFPKTIESVLSLLVEHFGSVLDYNKIYQILHEDLKTDAPESALKAQLSRKIIENYANLIEKGDLNALKWAPRINKSVDKLCGLGKKIAKKLYPVNSVKDENISFKLYRKKLTSGKITTLETKMCANEWSVISENLSKIPGKAMKKYKAALKDETKYGQTPGKRRHPEDDARTKCRDNLIELTAKAIENPESGLIKGGKTLQPHEIISKYLQMVHSGDFDDSKIDDVDIAQWKAVIAEVQKAGNLTNTLVMSDVSGSMHGIPMQVSIALGMAVAEIQTGVWKDRLLTFSSEPEWFQFKEGQTFAGRLKAISCMNWGYSTDLHKCFDMLLDLADQNNLSQNEIPDKVLILTDMEFDEATRGHDYDATHFTKIKAKFLQKGYTCPLIIFWNLRTSKLNFQNKSSDLGVVNLAGFSIALLKGLMGEDDFDFTQITPFKMLMKTLKKKRYEIVFEKIRDVGEIDLKNSDVEFV